MRNLIIGRGEVGLALAEIISEAETYDITDKKKPKEADILHIAFPYSDTFVKDARAYVKKYKPIATIVYSTVPIGTCRQIPAVHSPVEGRHPSLTRYIQRGVRWLGSDDKAQLYVAEREWRDLAQDVKIVSSSDFTEFLKLRSTAKYGVNLVWTDYEKAVADRLGMDFGLVKEFDQEYNRLYQGTEFQRYILDPPEGVIGGHCIVPNAALLDEQYPHDMLKAIKEMS